MTSKPSQKHPFALYADNGPDSQRAKELLIGTDVLFHPLPPDGEGKIPALVTPVGIFASLGSIQHYCEPGFHENVLAYLDECEKRAAATMLP